MKIFKGIKQVAVNNNTDYTPAIELGERISYFEALIQRIAGAGVCDITVQGTMKVNSANDDDWADLIDFVGISTNKTYSAGTRLATYDFVRARVTSGGIATVKISLVGVHL